MISETFRKSYNNIRTYITKDLGEFVQGLCTELCEVSTELCGNIC